MLSTTTRFLKLRTLFRATAPRNVRRFAANPGLTKPITLRAVSAHFLARPSWPGHAAFLLSGVSFLVSDVLHLRLFAFCSCVLTILFNYNHPVGRPIWLPIQWNAFYIVVNLIYIGHMLSERIVSLNYFEERTYEDFFNLDMSTGDFQKLIRTGTFEEAKIRESVINKGDVSPPVILVFRGAIEVDVGDGVIISGSTGFAGEISFLSGRGATATVYLLPGCQYVKWERDNLVALLEDNKTIWRGLERTMCHELGRKLAAMNEILAQRIKEAHDTQTMLKQDSYVDKLAIPPPLSSGVEPVSVPTRVASGHVASASDLMDFSADVTGAVQKALRCGSDPNASLDQLMNDLGIVVHKQMRMRELRSKQEHPPGTPPN